MKGGIWMGSQIELEVGQSIVIDNTQGTIVQILNNQNEVLIDVNGAKALIVMSWITRKDSQTIKINPARVNEVFAQLCSSAQQIPR